MTRIALVAVLMIGCGAPQPPAAKRWNTRRLIAGAQERETYAGFPASWFVTLKGESMPFRGSDYPSPAALAAADGWSVLPAFAVGQPAAFVVSELWANHPDPWLQPLYVPVSGFDPPVHQAVNGVPVFNTCGVGEDSTFYSPYWRAVLVTTREPTPREGLGDVRAVVGAATATQVPGPLPLCPLTPTEFSIAAETSTPTRPFTGAAIRPRSAEPTRIDGATPAYIDFGPGRFKADDAGRVVATRIFFFTRSVAGARALLELPAVLSDDAVGSAYARRYDVVLGAETVFVPAGPGWSAVRSRLGAPATDPAIPAAVAAAYALRVAKSPGCFLDASQFPAGCQWLDSEAAIDSLDSTRVVRTEVTLTAVPVLFSGETP